MGKSPLPVTGSFTKLWNAAVSLARVLPNTLVNVTSERPLRIIPALKS